MLKRQRFIAALQRSRLNQVARAMGRYLWRSVGGRATDSSSESSSWLSAARVLPSAVRHSSRKGTEAIN